VPHGQRENEAPEVTGQERDCLDVIAASSAGPESLDVIAAPLTVEGGGRVASVSDPVSDGPFGQDVRYRRALSQVNGLIHEVNADAAALIHQSTVPVEKRWTAVGAEPSASNGTTDGRTTRTPETLRGLTRRTTAQS